MKDYLTKAIDDINNMWTKDVVIDVQNLENLARRVIQALNYGGTIAFAGNGGSASEASHLAAEFTGKCLIDHRPLRAISLAESSTAMSAIGNDYGFHDVFVRQSEAFLNSNSIIVAMSTSGKSRNILRLIENGKSRGIYTVLWTGKAYEHKGDSDSADEIWQAPSSVTSRIQEVHLLWGHLLAELVELHYA